MIAVLSEASGNLWLCGVLGLLIYGLLPVRGEDR